MTKPSPVPRLPAGLLSPDAYPHDVQRPVLVVETHISWVLLTGPYAYKIKKPVRLSFLDYSTLDRRRKFCEEELRLNRRHATDLYLGVSAITGTVDAPRVGGDGEAFEYAVRMHQFDRAQELDALVAADGVAVEEVEALGARIARFHQAAAHADPAGPYGQPDAVQRVTMANFAELGRLPEAARWAALTSDLAAWAGAEHERTRELLAARRHAGRVRECHGDLHCGNVVRWHGELDPFDGIEFDAALRFIDVVSDLAFLTMDLAERGQRSLRRALLQSWTQTLGDFESLRLLPYFEVYRALVRAKVAALRALQSPTAGRERALDLGQAGRYLAWASRRTRCGAPGLVLTCGLSGSGKTWLADAIARRLRALHLRSDVERKRLAGLAPLDQSRSPPDGGIYTADWTTRTYQRMYDCATDALCGGEHVIVDAAFLRRDERLRMLALADRQGVPAAIVHCTAPISTLRERVSRRAEQATDASEADLATLARQTAWWEPFEESERSRVITIDTTADDAVENCAAALRRAGIAAAA
jgi:aminoglycoside phosphotransferase family enzyme/predicted kinase